MRPHVNVYFYYAYAMIRCLSVCVTSRCSIETAEWIELIVSTEATLDFPYAMLSGNSGIFSHKGTSVWNLVRNSERSRLCRFFATSRHVDVIVILVWRRQFITLSAHLCLQHGGRDVESYAVRVRQLRLVFLLSLCSQHSGYTKYPDFTMHGKPWVGFIHELVWIGFQ